MLATNANGHAGDVAVAEVIKSFPAFDPSQITENILNLQAAAVRRRFSVSSELALAVASLAFAKECRQ